MRIMDSAEVRRVLEIVGYATEKNDRELESYLDSVCGEDSLLRREVLSYLQFGEQGTLFTEASDNATAPEIPNAAKFESRYDLGDEIACGGMGVVFRAYDKNLRRDVAVKLLKEQTSEKPDVVHRFLQEAQIGGQLQHPGIAPVYEIGRMTNGHPFIAMKLIRGKTLASLLAERSDVTDDQARFVYVFELVCQAIAFAQTRGVVHRDLKPANIMVGEFGEVQVMDWGLAKIVGDDNPEEPTPSSADLNEPVPSSSDSNVDTDADSHRTRVGQVMGTPAYMPPEQPLGLSDEKTDVFALGSILCEILTGKPTAGDLDAANMRLSQSPSDQELIRLAKDCIERSPASRPQDASVVATRISGFLKAIQSRLRDAEIATARAEVKAAEERKRRQITLWTVAAITTLIGAACLVGWFIRDSVI
jgi:serine/threonine protein kinase